MDWLPFLSFVVSRVNTTSGIRYGDDRTIAMVGFAGEVDGIKGGDNTYGLTTDQLTVFYRDVQNFWHGAAPHQLLTAGGLSQLDWDSGIDWPAIFSLPHNDVVALHVYTSGDAAVNVPAVARFSQGIGKPWMIEEFGFPADLLDAERARRYAQMYDLAASYGQPALGCGMWGLRWWTPMTSALGSRRRLMSSGAALGPPNRAGDVRVVDQLTRYSRQSPK